MNGPRRLGLGGLILMAQCLASAQGDPAAPAGAAPFVLAGDGKAVTICVDGDGDGVAAVRRAADDIAEDVRRVTGLRPTVTSNAPSGPLVIVGLLGKSPVIDRLVREGRFDASGLSGLWESYAAGVVSDPMPGVPRALVICGSDRRGAIYGLYSISEALGVSPWAWWADVPIPKRPRAEVSASYRRSAPPAVKYRGIFLNDEDWGLRPWAAQTWDPATGNIGPKTYAKIFELILRLHGNFLWPAMHPGTRAFNFYPENARLAEAFGIVMGSSHAEPMLRDNVDEWARDGKGEYDYTRNQAGVLHYWEQRVQSNGRYENVYTLGMRGIHDGAMEGGANAHEKEAILRRVVSDQRSLLARIVNADPTRVPQLFCPYKEVLPLYREDPSMVPDDVTLLWPDDNFGYLQRLPSQTEQRRSGGSGVYYHVSYWGRPSDYLWLCSTPPALMGEELTRALRSGADRIWVLNVGDIKPAEIAIDFFFRLAERPEGWRALDGQHRFLSDWATRQFGAPSAAAIASVVEQYYHLNFIRKPEHMGIDPKNPLLSQPVFGVDVNDDEAGRRGKAYAALVAAAEAVGRRLPGEYSDAYQELVLYPVRASEAMNRKWLSLARFQDYVRQERGAAGSLLGDALSAQRTIAEDTRDYNERMAGGKWKGIMSDNSREQAVYGLPKLQNPAVPVAAALKSTTSLAPFGSWIPKAQFIDVFNRGSAAMPWTATPSADWILLNPASGNSDGRVSVSIDWTRLPPGGGAEGSIRIKGAGRTVEIPVSAVRGEAVDPRAAYAPVAGRIVIDASKDGQRTDGTWVGWEETGGIGYSGSVLGAVARRGATMAGAPNSVPDPRPAEVDYWIWTDGPAEWRLTARMLPAWARDPTHPVAFRVGLDSASLENLSIAPYRDERDPLWGRDVLRNAAYATSGPIPLDGGLHRLRILVDQPGVVLDGLMLERPEALPAGYLWPEATALRSTRSSPKR